MIPVQSLQGFMAHWGPLHSGFPKPWRMHAWLSETWHLGPGMVSSLSLWPWVLAARTHPLFPGAGRPGLPHPRQVPLKAPAGQSSPGQPHAVCDGSVPRTTLVALTLPAKPPEKESPGEEVGGAGLEGCSETSMFLA